MSEPIQVLVDWRGAAARMRYAIAELKSWINEVVDEYKRL